MARIKGGLNAKKKHNRVLKLAKGYRGARYAGMVAEAQRLPLRSPDQCLEAASDFWALGQLAHELGHTADGQPSRLVANSSSTPFGRANSCVSTIVIPR